MIWNFIFKKKKKIDPMAPIRREYVRIWHENRLMLLKSVPENMKNLSFFNKMAVKLVNWFKFMSIKKFSFLMFLWFMLDLIFFNFFSVLYFYIYYFVLKILIIRIYIDMCWKKNKYFNILKYEIVKKKYKKKIIFAMLFLFLIFIIYFLNPLFFLTLFK